MIKYIVTDHTQIIDAKWNIIHYMKSDQCTGSDIHGLANNVYVSKNLRESILAGISFPINGALKWPTYVLPCL